MSPPRIPSGARAALLPAALCAALTLGGCAESSGGGEVIALTGDTMGTTYAVKLVAPEDGLDARQLRSRIDSLLERVNDQMSTWRPDSELSRFNASGGLDWFPVSAGTALVVQAADAASVLSGGAFDATVGPLVNLWGFGPEEDAGDPPEDRAIAETMARVGHGRLHARTAPPGLRKERPDVYVDLSAIAKGYGVDEVARLLDGQGVTSYLVEIGGELRARGSKPEGSPWKVAIERPTSGERAVQRIVALRDAAIATSGDYRNYVEKDGVRYSHTIDPRNGRPIAHGLASVSVIAPTAMRADALATAIMVLGPDDGMALAEREALAAQLIVRSGDGFRVLATPSFEGYLMP